MSMPRSNENVRREIRQLQDLAAELQEQLTAVQLERKELQAREQGVFRRYGLPTRSRGAPSPVKLSDVRRRLVLESGTGSAFTEEPYSEDVISCGPWRRSAEVDVSGDENFDEETFTSTFTATPQLASSPDRGSNRRRNFRENNGIPAPGIPSPYLASFQGRRSSSSSGLGAVNDIQSPGWHVSHLESSPFRRSNKPGTVGGIPSTGIPSPYLASCPERKSSSRSQLGAFDGGIQSPGWRVSYLASSPVRQSSSRMSGEVGGIPPSGIPSPYFASVPVRRSGMSSDLGSGYGGIQSPDWNVSHLASSPLRRSSSSRLDTVGGTHSSRRPTLDLQEEKHRRIVGEICYQLDQRILRFIFPIWANLNECTVKNATKNMIEHATDPVTRDMDYTLLNEMAQRYLDIINELKSLGYDEEVHPDFSEHIINSYGILTDRPQPGTSEYDTYNDYYYLHSIIMNTVPEDIALQCICLLNCLRSLSGKDQRPMFCW